MKLRFCLNKIESECYVISNITLYLGIFPEGPGLFLGQLGTGEDVIMTLS